MRENLCLTCTYFIERLSPVFVVLNTKQHLSLELSEGFRCSGVCCVYNKCVLPISFWLIFVGDFLKMYQTDFILPVSTKLVFVTLQQNDYTHNSITSINK